MKVDRGIGSDMVTAGRNAKEAEEAGFDGVWSSETVHDPLLPLALAAEHTSRVDLGTSIVVAFARSPMNMAVMANDLQVASRGRMILGLGSQIRPHIENRFSMPWSHPAPRMRELIQAMRAIWACWHDGAPLNFRGQFYRHTLMTPFFNPGPSEYGSPKVFLAAVGPVMCEVAGEVADGLLSHGFSTERYLREVVLPAVERGAAKAGRSRADLEISAPGFVVTGRDESELQKQSTVTKRRIAFYGSTPAYRPVFEVHGWGPLQEDLNRLSKQGEWDAMGDLIDDEVLDAFAVVGAPDEIVARMVQRYGDVVDRVHFDTETLELAGIHTGDELKRAMAVA